jgi:glycosyltransferase involved in cell wall biosynthesis
LLTGGNLLRFGNFLEDQRVYCEKEAVLKPAVTVIMPTYCRAHDGMLARAVKSVLSQTFTDFEFIVLDDGSTDGSEEILQDFRKQDSRIIYIRHETNSGLPALRVDEGILLAKGEYLAFQFDDDEWLPDYLKRNIEDARRNKARFLCTRAKYMLEGKLFHESFPMVAPVHASLIQGNKMANAAMIVHRSLFDLCGLYDPHVVMRRFTDWDLWLRFIDAEPIHLVPDVLVRINGGLADSLAKRSPWIDYEDVLRLNSIDRNSELLPGDILNYDLVSLDKYKDVYSEAGIAKIYKEQIVPWLQLHGAKSEFVEVAEAPQNPGFLESLKKRINSWGSNHKAVYSIMVSAYTAWIIFGAKIRLFIDDIRQALGSKISLDLTKDENWRSSWQVLLGMIQNGYFLRNSADLKEVNFIDYGISIDLEQISSLKLAFNVELPGSFTGGTIVIQAFSKNYGMTSTLAALRNIRSHVPVEFYFEPPIRKGKWRLRIRGENLSGKVHVLEFAKYHRLLTEKKLLFFVPEIILNKNR